jgi:DNA-binding NarL/FixJ family response regulator
MLLGLLENIDLVGSAEDGEDALELVQREHPDIVLMDLRMPHMDGVEATKRIRADHPDTQVIVLTTYADDQSIYAALKAGARGYLTKDAGAEDIERAIRTVHAGEVLLAPEVQARLLADIDRKRSPASSSLPGGLTAKEADVLMLAAEGLSNTEIAGRLVVSEATVKTHINHIFAKLGVRDRAQAVAYAYRVGLVSPDEGN